VHGDALSHETPIQGRASREFYKIYLNIRQIPKLKYKIDAGQVKNPLKLEKSG